MKPRKNNIVLLVIAFVATVVGIVVLRGRSAEDKQSPARAPEPAPASAPAPPLPKAETPSAPAASTGTVPDASQLPAPKPPAPRAAQLSEREIMERLHALGSADPASTLELAREGNRRFRRSADAPERASLIVKALSSLGRHDEARAEALKMEREYPGSDFTHDVHRHMFVNPPTHPAERGYGKKLELE